MFAEENFVRTEIWCAQALFAFRQKGGEAGSVDEKHRLGVERIDLENLHEEVRPESEQQDEGDVAVGRVAAEEGEMGGEQQEDECRQAYPAAFEQDMQDEVVRSQAVELELVPLVVVLAVADNRLTLDEALGSVPDMRAEREGHVLLEHMLDEVLRLGGIGVLVAEHRPRLQGKVYGDEEYYA